MKAAWLLTFLAAAPASAATTGFQAARITVSSSATVEQHRYRESGKEIPAPSTVMDVYIWREGDDGTDHTISLVEDVFEIAAPREAVLVTGNGPMRIRSSYVEKIEPLAAPLDGRKSSTVMPVSQRDAVLLRSGPPKFTCSLGWEGATQRALLSWKKGGKSFSKVCVDDPAQPQRATPKKLEALAKAAGVVVLEFREDDAPDH